LELATAATAALGVGPTQAPTLRFHDRQLVSHVDENLETDPAQEHSVPRQSYRVDSASGVLAFEDFKGLNFSGGLITLVLHFDVFFEDDVYEARVEILEAVLDPLLPGSRVNKSGDEDEVAGLDENSLALQPFALLAVVQVNKHNFGPEKREEVA